MEQDFSLLIFGKALANVSLDDVQHYFQSPKTESDKQEFKSFPSDLSGAGTIKETERAILRSICAFLNSEGGILIWGAPAGEVIAGQKEKIYQGNVTSSTVLYEKDAFIAKIANRIIPSPKGILFHRIEDQGKYLYLLAIPASEYSPHQFENIYYMRVDGQSLAAPHHYIEALFRKVTFPKLETFLRIDSYQQEATDRRSLTCTLIFRNLSRYQNDLNLHCRVISDQGMILDIGKVYIAFDKRIEEGSDFLVEKIADVIYYGNYLHYSFNIILLGKFLHQTNYEFKVVVTFGARFSPMKISEYTLKVGPTFPDNKQAVIIEKEENRYFHETERFGRLSDEEVLKRILNS